VQHYRRSADAALQVALCPHAAVHRPLDLMADGTSNGRIAREVFEAMVDTGEVSIRG
jgi:hypothetical protein